MKTLVVCIDGTWNHPLQTDSDPMDPELELVTESNVLRMFHFLTGASQPASLDRPMPMSRKLAEELGTALYLPGVGSGGALFAKKWDGATGAGTWQRILQAYRFIAEHHEPDDQVFGFGFSRGAFAVRSLAGLLHHVGLPSEPRLLTQRDLDEIGSAYRHQTVAPVGFSTNRPARVDFLGIWDTVGAVAADKLFGRFHNLSPANVRRVAHALALDEQRGLFAPEYWNGSGTPTVVEEVWFSGAHSNIGGGYVNPELSNIALAWVVSRAVKAGLPTKGTYIEGWYQENTFGRGRNSHQEFWRHLKILAPLMTSPRAREVREGQGIHASVFDRMKELPSEYSTGGLSKPDDWRPYTPAARLASGHSLSAMMREVFKGRISETPDYLSGPAASN